MDYVKKLEQLASERNTFKNNVHKHKLQQLGLMENVGLYTQPVLAAQEKTREAIDSLSSTLVDNEQLSQIPPKKQIEFQDTFQIDFRNIDQNLPKSIRPVFSQDGFKIGRVYIEVDREQRLMRVHGKQNTYAITQELVDLIKGLPLENYGVAVLNDYKNLLDDVEGSTRAKRIKQLSGLVKSGEGFVFLPDNVDELQARLEKLSAAAKEGHSNVFNEGMAILKRLLELGAITQEKFKQLSKIFS